MIRLFHSAFGVTGSNPRNICKAEVSLCSSLAPDLAMQERSRFYHKKDGQKELFFFLTNLFKIVKKIELYFV